MSDIAHEETEAGLEELKKKIKREYRKATKEVKQKYENYLAEFEEKDKVYKKMLKKGEITEEQYKAWHWRAVAGGTRWQKMLDTLALDLTTVDAKAMSMTKEYMPDAYAINYNYGSYLIDSQLTDSKISAKTSYTLMDRDTVEILLRDDPDLMPVPKLNKKKDFNWNKQKINSAVTQGILQGESNQDIANRLTSVVNMDYHAAIRTARTMTTCAENMGRQASYKRAQRMGIDIMQQWLATGDSRTRDSHVAVDGEKRKIGKPFSNGCRFPGDPTAVASEIYNCRCTTIALVDGLDYGLSDKDNIKRIENHRRYEKWKENNRGVRRSIGSSKIGSYTAIINGAKVQIEFPDFDVLEEGYRNRYKTYFKKFEEQIGEENVLRLGYMIDECPNEDVKKCILRNIRKENLAVAQTSWPKSFHHPDTEINGGGIYTDIKLAMNGNENLYPTELFFHELWHNIDYVAGESSGRGGQYFSASPESSLGKALARDFANLTNGKKPNDLIKELQKYYIENGTPATTVSKISDIIEGLTGKSKPLYVKNNKYGHGTSYYNIRDKHTKKVTSKLSDYVEKGETHPYVSNEFIASTGGAICSGNTECYNEIARLFPESVAEFEKFVKYH